MDKNPKSPEEIIAALKALIGVAEPPQLPDAEGQLAQVQELTDRMTKAVARVVQEMIDDRPTVGIDPKTVQAALIGSMSILFGYESMRRVTQAFRDDGQTQVPVVLLQVAYRAQLEGDGEVAASELRRMMDFHGPRIFNTLVATRRTF